MDEKTIKVGLLGTGVIATPHIEALQLLGGQGVRVVAVCDRDQSKGKEFQARHGVENYYSDLDEMLERSRPDVVHVLLPPVAHAAAAGQCVRKKTHVFVEKPFCLTAADCRRVWSEAEANGVTVGVNHNLTYMPAFLRLIEHVRSGAIGAIEHVRVLYNLPFPGIEKGPHRHWMFASPENLILELGPHPISLATRLLGTAKRVSALASGPVKTASGSVFYRHWQSSLECERGLAQVVLSLGGGYMNGTAHVVGQDGEVYADLRRNTMWCTGKTPYRRLDNEVDGLRRAGQLLRQSGRNWLAATKGMLGLGPVYQMQNHSVNASVSDFYAALRAKRQPLTGADQGTAVVDICERVVASGLAGWNAQ